MHRGLVCGVGVLTCLAIIPTPSQADILGGLFRGVGGLFGGTRTHHHRHVVRRESPALPSPVRAAPQFDSWLGALYWPQAYRDTFGYIVSGMDEASAFWRHSGNDIYDGVFVPAMASTLISDRALDVASACAGERNQVISLGAIEQTLRPAEAQPGPAEARRAGLEALRGALVQASERVRTSCPGNPTALGPTARLESMWNRLRALRQAVGLIRAPLKAFYDSLSDEQKARLNALSDSTAPRRRGEALGLEVCTESASKVPQWPAKQIEEVVRPSDQQRASLSTLATTTSHLSAVLLPSCPPHVLVTPTGRLEAVVNRLDSMIYAVTLERAALNNFYAALNDDQKAKFGADVGQPPRTFDHRLPP